MPQTIPEINIKRDWPTVAIASERLRDEIVKAKRLGLKLVKIIHGYGSTGKGGVLRDELREQLAAMQKSGTVRRIVFGEDLNMFERATADLTGMFPELLKDPDYNRSNRGITIVAL